MKKQLTQIQWDKFNNYQKKFFYNTIKHNNKYYKENSIKIQTPPLLQDIIHFLTKVGVYYKLSRTENDSFELSITYGKTYLARGLKTVLYYALIDELEYLK